MSALLLLQQSASTTEPPKALQVADAWSFWDVDTIARATRCPADNVSSDWPAVFAELDARGIASKRVCAGVLGTIAIETASSFKPIEEAFYLGSGADAFRKTLRYYPWYGRGYVQLTWQSNYEQYGNCVGVDLLSDPTRAMDPDTAAKIIAEYFQRKGVAAAADQADWTEVRRLVQGGADGLERLITIVKALGMPT